MASKHTSSILCRRTFKPHSLVLFKIRTLSQRQLFCSSFSSFSTSSSSIPDEVTEMVHEYSQKPQTSVSMQTLTRTGRGELLQKQSSYIEKEQGPLTSCPTASEQVLMQVAGFIRREMPIRLARRIKDLENVPYLRDMSSVQAVKDIYISSFLSLVKEPPIESSIREALFARKLDLLYERHSSVLIQMAKGAYELRQKVREGTDSNHQNLMDFEHMDECHAFLDRFYMSRIGIRVLAGQYLALRSPTMDGYIGLIYQHTSPYHVVKAAVADASYMCEKMYGDFPDVLIKGRIDLCFAYVPTQLHYILLELLKNAMRATIEHHGASEPHRWPNIEVIIADGQENEDVVIKIADEGGGIPRSNMKKIWSYLFTTADPGIQDRLVGGIGEDNVDHSVEAPLAGLGYGLPISKSYARYFGGDISLESIQGYGTDAYVHLRRLGDSKEPLPI